jgi:hypothetical protein
MWGRRGPTDCRAGCAGGNHCSAEAICRCFSGYWRQSSGITGGFACRQPGDQTSRLAGGRGECRSVAECRSRGTVPGWHDDQDRLQPASHGQQQGSD